MTKFLERKLIEALQKNFNDKQVAKRMAYMKEHSIENDYKHLPVEKAIFEIEMYLEDLEECSICEKLEESEHLVNTWCRSCRESYL